MGRDNFCRLHGNTDAPCPECDLLRREAVDRLTRERDEARQEVAIQRALAEETGRIMRSVLAERDEARAYAVKEREAAHIRELALLAERDRLRALLRQVEWQPGGWCALHCQQHTHAPDCELAAALEEREALDHARPFAAIKAREHARRRREGA